MCERVGLAIEAVRRLNPHPNRHARYVPNRNQYVQVSRAPTDDELEKHVRGVALLGGVSSDDQGTTTSVGLDLDAHTTGQHPLVPAKNFTRTCQALDVPVVLHTSKSGTGCHIRTLFRHPVSTWLARALFIALAIAAEISADKAVDKVWPPSRGYGVLALPYQSAYAKQVGGTLAIDPTTFKRVPKGEQVEAVTEADDLQPDDILGLLDFMGVKSEQAAKILSGGPLHTSGVAIKEGTDRGIQEMVSRCAAVRRLQDESTTIPYEFWFGMMTNFKPYWGGKDLFQALSELDTKRWNERAFEASWRAITGKPRYCENLERGWVCPERSRCSARAPAGLPFAVRRQNCNA